MMITTTRNRATTGKVMALGLLLAALLAAMLLIASQAHASTTFTVINTNDSGAGSLRQAILYSNDTPGADTIKFDIPGSGVHTISPASKLPTITDAVTIDGYSQPGATANTLAVGTNANLVIELDGSKAPTNSGLYISASNSTVKGLVINRFGDSGINITDFPSPTAVGNRIEGNFIGTDPSGTQDLGNGDDGITIDVGNSGSNTVGGTSLASRNLISGNTDGGIFISSGNQVRGNLIGTKKDGITALGNGVNGGVLVDESASIVAGNTIAFNLGAGVWVDYGNGNRVLSNSIFSNGGIGIDLGAVGGATANDAGDADTGPNDLQNKPVIRSARTGGKTTVSARLNSTPNRTFRVQFFSNPSGTNEGKKFIGQKSVTTDGSGNVSFAFSPAQKVGLGRTITATATSPAGNTSEFSAPRTVVAR